MSGSVSAFFHWILRFHPIIRACFLNSISALLRAVLWIEKSGASRPGRPDFSAGPKNHPYKDGHKEIKRDIQPLKTALSVSKHESKSDLGAEHASSARRRAHSYQGTRAPLAALADKLAKLISCTIKSSAFRESKL